ncbi:hypothetical protein [Rhodohalobacter sp.]|uniref:alpha/beta hydrolase n=1 Tax=Rhodohalobacter sp. TaxID=1974210 RepID=UPI002ACDE98C|nr:hypothetical protein [Rhodohalobacter sp.]MDZ7756039.1 hypothetical protein [Rhodohalobacter sp.]
MREVLRSSTATYPIEVPFRLIETGERSEEKPLILYLHGFNQNMDYFEKKMEPLLQLNAYHLFIQGPYPIYDTTRKKDLSKWGRAWYLYDGGQEQFIHSLEKASGFIQGILDDLKADISYSRLCVFGYSMGGYLGGYFALSRPSYVQDLIVAGGRIKTEVFDGKREKADHINILALHGRCGYKRVSRTTKRDV